jgi:hypothetical protein
MMEQGMSATVTKRSTRTHMNTRYPAFRGVGHGVGTPSHGRTGLQGGIRSALSPNSAAFMGEQRQPDGE